MLKTEGCSGSNSIKLAKGRAKLLTTSRLASYSVSGKLMQLTPSE